MTLESHIPTAALIIKAILITVVPVLLAQWTTKKMDFDNEDDVQAMLIKMTLIGIAAMFTGFAIGDAIGWAINEVMK